MRKTWRMIRIFFLAIWRLVFEYFAWILPCSRHPEKYPIRYRYEKGRKLVLFILSKLKINLQVENASALTPQQPTIYIANHVGALDPLFHIAVSPRPVAFIAKKEAKKIPIAGRFIKAIGCVFLDREDPFQAVRAFREAVNQMRTSGISYVIFPEGTRQKDVHAGRCNAFHPGSFKLATMAKAPLVIYAQYGSFHAFGQQKGRSHLVQMRVLETLEATELAKYNTVELSTHALSLIDTDYPKMILNEKNYVLGQKTKDKAPKWWKNTL